MFKMKTINQYMKISAMNLPAFLPVNCSPGYSITSYSTRFYAANSAHLFVIVPFDQLFSISGCRAQNYWPILLRLTVTKALRSR